jgi:16S rRNA (uracil1498-N3)-methyltransferase
MRQSRLFVPQDLAAGGLIALEPAPSHYLRNVLRVSVAAPVTLFNGQGGEHLGHIASISKSVVCVQLSHFSSIDRASPLPVRLGLCITKRDAMDTAIQMATELGVNHIQPILSEHTSVGRQAAEKRNSHWQQIIYSACEQSGLNRPPLLGAVMPLDTWLANATAELKLVADPSGTVNLLTMPAAPLSIDLLIGPEGGFAEAELQCAAQQGFICAGLGPRILRAAHAPAALIGLLQARFGDLQPLE